jgi:quercetin dioxygenase-like cupin family protein
VAVEGKVKSTVGEEEFIMGPGDVCRYPIGVMHRLDAIEESDVVEIKSPAPDIGAFFAVRKEDWPAGLTPSKRGSNVQLSA